MKVYYYCCDKVVELVKSGAIHLPFENVQPKSHYIYAELPEPKDAVEICLYFCPNCGEELPTESKDITAVEVK